MPTRVKKLVGLLVLLIGLFVYAVGAMHLALAWNPGNVLVQTLYYAIAGIAWAFPTIWLVKWMNRPSAKELAAHTSET